MNYNTLLKSNWAESYVAEWLSRCGCYVRTVPQGRDIGIDLYCETTFNNEPFLHFWIQVKLRDFFSAEKESNGSSIKISDINYWIMQPVPVFVFYVPLKPLEENNIFPLFICSLTKFLIKDFSKSTNESVTLKSSIKITNDAELKKFLDEILKFETFEWELNKGKVRWLPDPIEEYVKYFPVGITHRYEKQLKISLWHTLWRLSEDILKQYFDLNTLEYKINGNKIEDIEKVRPYIEALESIVRGKNIPQCNPFATIGILKELDEKLNEAEECYKEAIKRIDGDPNIKPLSQFSHWQNIRDKYERYLVRVREKKKNKEKT